MTRIFAPARQIEISAVNLLIYAHDTSSPFHTESRTGLVDALLNRSDRLYSTRVLPTQVLKGIEPAPLRVSWRTVEGPTAVNSRRWRICGSSDRARPGRNVGSTAAADENNQQPESKTACSHLFRYRAWDQLHCCAVDHMLSVGETYVESKDSIFTCPSKNAKG